MTDEIPSAGPCIGCKEETSDESFCYGCKAFVCENCMVNDVTGFSHSADDHLQASTCCEARILSGECANCGQREEE
jgi:hypothetical protein